MLFGLYKSFYIKKITIPFHFIISGVPKFLLYQYTKHEIYEMHKNTKWCLINKVLLHGYKGLPGLGWSGLFVMLSEWGCNSCWGSKRGAFMPPLWPTKHGFASGIAGFIPLKLLPKNKIYFGYLMYILYCILARCMSYHRLISNWN